MTGFGQPPSGPGGFGPPGDPNNPFGQQPPPGGFGGAPPAFGNPEGSFNAGGPPQQKTETLAIVSIATGVAGLISCCCCFFLPLPLAAIVTGVLAMNKIKEDPTLKGKEMAIAGIAVGGLTLLITVGLTIVSLIMNGTAALTTPPWQQGY